MIALLQRVTQARVEVRGESVAQIGRGLLALIGVRPADTPKSAERLLERILKYRIFPDDSGKMNVGLLQIRDAGLLLVPQFTLAADTRHGLRPGFSTAAPPAQGAALYEHLVRHARAQHCLVGSGVFGADMQVSLVNDGPVTIWLES
jgi:D-tyrosyl-tRNA(Tyr) deacylase